MSWWLGIAYFLGAVLALGGTSAAKGCQEFFSKSKELENKLISTIKVDNGSQYDFSTKFSELFGKIVEKGTEVATSLETKFKSSVNER